MPKTLRFTTSDSPRVSPAELRRFRKVATIRDKAGFLKQLDTLLREQTAYAERLTGVPTSATRTLRQKANALKAASVWEPSATELQRGRAAILQEFDDPQNLPLTEFAILARKSRQQIYKDIAARRLLALNVGVRGQRLPDWQLDPTLLRFTQEVLARTEDIDAWTLFHALSEPMDRLHGKSPLTAARSGNFASIVKTVLNALGIRGPHRDLERA